MLHEPYLNNALSCSRFALSAKRLLNVANQFSQKRLVRIVRPDSL